MPPTHHGFNAFLSMYSVIAYVFEATSAALSAVMIYQLLFKKQIHNKLLNRFLTFLHVVNLFYQIAAFCIFFFDPTNPKWWSLIWLVENGLLTAINYVNLLILKIFSILRPQITSFKIQIGQACLLVGYILVSVLPFVRLVSDVANHLTQIEEWVGCLWVLISIFYDTVQAFYLTFIVYFYSKERGIVNQSSKQKVWINLGVVLFDWTTIGIFMYQAFNQKDVLFKQMVQQVAIAMTGIHFTFTFVMFQNLTELSLGPAALEKHHKAKETVPTTGMDAKKTIFVPQRDHTDLANEAVLSIQWTEMKRSSFSDHQV
jgi:hypothetical protein